jgi:uncharacterized delta-60 repeat protein
MRGKLAKHYSGAIGLAARRCAAFLLGTICLSLSAIAAPGDLDLAFSGDGKLLSTDGGFAEGRAIAIQPDGKILVAGHQLGSSVNEFVVLRLMPDGALDSSFGTTGRVRTPMGTDNAYATAVTAQQDGKVLVAGYCDSGSSTYFCLARYNGNGALDNTFGVFGKVIASSMPSGFARAIALQSDGVIVVAGYCFASPNLGFCVARFNADGSLDTTFNTSGSQFTQVGVSNDYGYAVALTPFGQIYVAGHCLTGAPAPASEFCLAKYNIDGSLISNFGAGGKVLTNMGTVVANGYALALDRGKPVVAGRCDGDFCLARYNVIDGSLDTSFGGDGKVITAMGSGSDSAQAVAVQYDGQIVVAGYCAVGARTDFCLARYNNDGSLDASFGASGKVFTAVGAGNDLAYAVTTQANGRIVVAGACDTGDGINIYEPCIARYQGIEGFGCSLDIDGDKAVRATTDSLRHLRAVYGFQSAANINLDLDGDGARGITDTLIHARIAFGFRGNAVTDGLEFSVNASRTTWFAIRSYLVTQCGATLPP